MQYQQYAIEMELTGITRKRAAEAMSGVLGKPYSYHNDADAYAVKDRFDREWLAEPAEGITSQRVNGDRIIGANPLYAVKINTPLLYERDFEEVSTVLEQLRDAGAITNDTTKLAVNIKGKTHTAQSLQNLSNLMESKGEIVYKAVQSQNPRPPEQSEINGEPVTRFPMFNASLSADRVQSYVQLASGMNHLAVKQNHISPKRNESPNEKFTFRTWLIRLGMVGAEYKNTRAVLLENLVGNSAWKNPEMAPGQRAAAAPEILPQQPEREQAQEPEVSAHEISESHEYKKQGMVFGSM